MAEEEIATPEQIAEYESQLEGINELLEASPGDESLLELKRDMEQLLELSKANLAQQQQNEEGPQHSTSTAATEPADSGSLEDLQLPPPPAPVAAFANDFASLQADASAAATANNAALENGAAAAAAALPDHVPTQPKKSKPKKEKIEEFVLPAHLVPNEADTEAERNKKRRAAKALKSKWRAHKKEVESNNKQKSWQSFQKKTKRMGKEDGGSIFSTQESVSDRVGVVSKKQMTEFGARKRHKHM
jgi:survival-of-motor-neuron-related-splicing factor 30